jgi:putative endonuclease
LLGFRATDKRTSRKIYKKAFTSQATDWELFLSIENLDYKCARAIEAHIKKMKSKIYLENLKKYPEITERLKKRYCESSFR